ncbi:RAMP superfamily CRISPR-associated protein [Nodularia sp. UHCC 0506]|uniref:RAMP superfamily CRISPR-associated protein n=1 Tax=Nodularia sp. UHCC 0506 TaxID=3110243 RepID=UPI002B20DE18|nr:RAMP superfamily CRISPR-associated protein [Nodularia sp. UHCC 0506]MEA5515825.1 RAMP superfamily CRISPR-associated protein [Nodularia sp. UHCC 0506]
MNKYQLKIQILSDTTFGRGDGVAGLIDQEVQHDAFGFPYLQGRTLKGLLSEECDNLISTISSNQHRSYWENIACDLFGIPGSDLKTMGIMHVGDACLPNDLRQSVGWQLKQESPTLTTQEVIDSLTTIRRQTGIDDESGVSVKGSLRSFRVVIRGLEFTTDLHFQSEPNNEILSLLSVGTLALRHIGSGRNRGRGCVRCTLHNSSDENITHDYINLFATISGEN